MAEYRNQMARDFAQRIAGLGFRVFVARDGTGEYGFIADETGEHVLSFSMNDGGSLGGNYGPPSQESGTGWRMDTHPSDLRTADDVRKALRAYPPNFCGKGWRRLSTLQSYLGMYGNSSRFSEVES